MNIFSPYCINKMDILITWIDYPIIDLEMFASEINEIWQQWIIFYATVKNFTNEIYENCINQMFI